MKAFSTMGNMLPLGWIIRLFINNLDNMDNILYIVKMLEKRTTPKKTSHKQMEKKNEQEMCNKCLSYTLVDIIWMYM